ncbi:MAG TPA: Ig-like domain-containing protein [Cellulomonas sp.]
MIRLPGRRVTTAAAVVTIPVLVATLAVLDRGFPLARLDLDDGAVWVTATDRGMLGRYNVPVEELNAGLASDSARFDVLQDGSDVLLVGASTVAVVDPATVATVAEVAAAGVTTSMAGGTVAFADADGNVWVRPIGSLSGLHLGQDPADVALGPGGQVVVARSGAALAVSAADGTVTRVTGTGQRAAGNVGAGAIDQVTAVGDEPVVLAGDELRTRHGTVDLPGDGFVLQQPGPAATSVLVASRTALLEVPLNGGPVVQHASGGSGTPARPVRVDGCGYAAWATRTGSYLQTCGGRDDLRRDLADVGSGDALVFRVNRSMVVLNDAAAGRLWLPSKDSDVRVPDWEQVAPQPKSQPDTQQTQSTLSTDLVSECGQDSGAPQAADDEFGVRPGRTTVLPVLDNDSTSDCGILAISEFDALPASFGVLQPVYGGRALQVRVAADAHGTAQVTYTITDGRGTTPPSTATLTLRVADGSGDGAPVQVRVPTATVDQGGRVSLDVLSSFRDPDGDDLMLVGATADPAAGTVRTRQDGTLTFQADGGTLGEAKIAVRVTDGTDTADGYVTVDVRPEGSVPPHIDPVFAVTYVDQPVTVRPLDSVRSASKEPVALAGVDDVVGATVTTDLLAGTFTFRAPRSGTYYVPFTVTEPPQQAAGLARVDVLDWPDQSAPPVAVRDRALLPAGGQVTLDPLANDEDPSGGVLVLQSVDVPDGYGLHAAVLDHHLVQITADRAPDGPVSLTYTVSNGAASATGEIVVLPVPASGSSQAPVVDNVEASVRTGGVVTVPVLDTAYDPDGDALSLVQDLPEPLGAGQGLLFVSGDVLRYQAPATPMTVRATFAVSDAAGNTTAATLTVRVHASAADSKAPPRPRDLTARVFAGDTVRIDVPLVGIDPDGDGVTLLGLASAPTKGVVTAAANSLSYQAFGDESGTDTFTYAVEDWTGRRAVATVRVGIAPRPTTAASVVARDDAVTVRPGELVEVRVLANDVDSSGGTLSLDPALEVPAGVQATADVGTGRVSVTAPQTPGVVQVVYTATNARGGRDTAILTVTVSPDAPVLPPVARDVVVPASDTFGKTQVTVDVLATAQNPSGPMSDLAVSVPDVAADVAYVAPDSTVVVTLADHAQTLPFLLTNTREPSAFAYAFITVPALGNFPPVLRRDAPDLTVASGQQLVIPLDEHVQVAPGRSASIADVSGVSATRSDGSGLVRDAKTLTFTSADGYAGPASITVPVTDATGPGDPLARTALLTIPITVIAVDDHPPAFAPSQIRVAPGETPVTVDLLAFLTGPDGRPAQADDYTFRLTSAVPAGFVAPLRGSVLSVSAGEATAKGTAGTLDLAIGYGKAGVLDVSVDVVVIASTRQRAKVVTQHVNGGVQGRDSTVDVLSGAYNPFPDSPLTVVGVSVQTAGAGTAAIGSGGNVVMRPAADFVGEMVATFRVRDVTGDPDRDVEGEVVLVVSGPPATPAPPRVDEVRDGAVALSWTAPDSRGQPIDSYRVTAMPGMLVKVCASTACTFDGLTNDVEYTFTVEAHNAVGWSPVSAASAPARPDAVPDPPTGLALAFGDGTLTASWVAPPQTGSPVTSYTLELTGSSSGVVTATETSTSHTFTGLKNGTSYTVRVRAQNKAPSPSGWSVSASEVPAAAPDAPAPDASRRQGGLTGNTVDVTWAPVEGAAANGDAVARYEVSIDGGTPVDVGTATAYQVANAERRSYAIRVRAVNKAGASAWGSVTGEVWSAPGAPTGLVAAPSTAADARDPGNGVVVLSWVAPVDAGGADATITGYEVDGYGTFGGAGATISGLGGGSTPTFRVRALSSKGASSDWAQVTSGVVVTRPSNPTVTLSSGPQVDCVSIAVGAGPDGGAPVLETQYRLNLTDPWVTVDAGHPLPSSTCVPGTPDPVAVTLEVRQRNAAGDAAWSTGKGSAATAAPSVPAKMTIALSAGHGRVTWTPPASDRPITGYEYQVTTDGGASFSAPAAVPNGAGATSLRFRDVGLAGAFGVRIHALNVKGAGEWSDVLSVTP